MKTLIIRLVVISLILISMIGFAIWRAGKTVAPQEKLVGFQDWDTPFFLSESIKPDRRFHILSAWQAYQIPQITEMDFPMGTENGGFTYNAQAFWEINQKRGGYHLGDDFNGIGGMDTDLGDPVYASGDGLVLYQGEPSEGWGNIIILAHRLADGKIVQTMYSHLDQIKTTPNALVARGEIIGTVGNAHGNYPAHLHLEARLSDGVSIGRGYALNALHFINPTSLIHSLHEEDHRLRPSVLRLLQQQSRKNWTTLEIQNAEKLYGLHDEINEKR